MASGREKNFRKYLKFYGREFSLEPHKKVLVDGTFLHQMKTSNIDPRDMKKAVGAVPSLYTTPCVLDELTRLYQHIGSDLPTFAWLNVYPCPHSHGTTPSKKGGKASGDVEMEGEAKEGADEEEKEELMEGEMEKKEEKKKKTKYVAAAKCMKVCVENTLHRSRQRWSLATQDPSLRIWAHKFSGEKASPIPVLTVSKGVVNLEGPSSHLKAALDAIKRGQTMPSRKELEESLELEGVKLMKKKKKKKKKSDPLLAAIAAGNAPKKAVLETVEKVSKRHAGRVRLVMKRKDRLRAYAAKQREEREAAEAATRAALAVQYWGVELLP